MSEPTADEPPGEPLLPLFAYGTLRDPDYQRELFGRTYPMQRARAAGWQVYSTGGGYLAAKITPNATIDGALVALDAQGYAVADAWEDLDVYQRIEIEAYDRHGELRPAYIYAVPEADGRALHDGRLADRSRAQVIADIRHFHAARAAKADSLDDG